MNKITFGCVSHNSWHCAELKPDMEFDSLTARITYDYNKGGLARFYTPVKEILGLNSAVEALNLFKDCRDKGRRFDVTIEQAFQLAELFNKYSKYSMEYLDIEGTTVEDAERDKIRIEYLSKENEERRQADAWYKTLSPEEKKHVDVLSRYIPPAG